MRFFDLKWFRRRRRQRGDLMIAKVIKGLGIAEILLASPFSSSS